MGFHDAYAVNNIESAASTRITELEMGDFGRDRVFDGEGYFGDTMLHRCLNVYGSLEGYLTRKNVGVGHFAAKRNLSEFG